jgi:hypothetical protein
VAAWPVVVRKQSGALQPTAAQEIALKLEIKGVTLAI